MDSVTVPRGLKLEGVFGEEKEEEPTDSAEAPPATHQLKFNFNSGKYSNYWISEPMTEEEAQEIFTRIRTGSYQRFYQVGDTLINIPQVTCIEILEETK